MRSLALAESLSADFRVLILNGGRLPKQMRVSSDVEIINLPPFVAADEIILETYENEKPEVLLIELFPFGRKSLPLN